MRTLSTLSLLSIAAAWGELGHRTAAHIGMEVLKTYEPEVYSSLMKILDGKFDPISSASWPDKVSRTKPKEFSKPFHYTEGDDWVCGDDSFASATGCPVGNTCSTNAIEYFMATTSNTVHYDKSLDSKVFGGWTAPEALVWIIHLFGDIHQPMHAGFDSDLGANTITGVTYSLKGLPAQAARNVKPNTASKLHSLWDGDFVTVAANLRYSDASKHDESEQGKSPYDQYPYLLTKDTIKSLRADLNAAKRLLASSGPLTAIKTWTRETSVLACTVGYPATEEDRLKRKKCPSNATLSSEYTRRTSSEIIPRQLSLAGARMAAAISHALTAPHFSPEAPEIPRVPRTIRGEHDIAPVSVDSTLFEYGQGLINVADDADASESEDDWMFTSGGWRFEGDEVVRV